MTNTTPEQIAKDLLYLSENPKERAALAKRARQWISETQDVNMSLDKFSGLFKRLAKQAKV